MDSTIVQEEWKPVVGYEGWYSISNLGRLRRDMPCHTGTGIRNGHRHTQTGYVAVVLTRGGKAKPSKIHNLVMAAFVGPRPAGLVINHKNGVKTDNRVTNLEYVTPRENVLHSIAVLGNACKGSANGNASLVEDDVRKIRLLYATGNFRQVDLAAQFGVPQVQISQIVLRKQWKHVA